jgi:hypothetical protein
MRRFIASVLSFLLLSGVMCHAEDLTPANEQSTQSIKAESSGVLFKVQKQPVTESNKQQMNVKKCFFCVLIQVNGKIKEDLK